MAASTISQIDYLWKEYYDSNRVVSLTLQDNVLLDMLKKDESFVGRYMPLPVLTEAGQGISVPFATAQTNGSNATGQEFAVFVGDTYGSLPFDDKALTAARNDIGAFANFKMQESDEFMRQLGRVASIQIWGDGSGSVARLAASGAVSGSTITLADANKIINIHIGMKLVASANDGTGTGHALRDSGNAITVTGVNINAGTFTFSGAISGLTNDDYIFRQGVFAGNVTQTSIIKGMQSWVPASDPTSGDSLFGLDRSVSTKLSGVRMLAAEEAGYIKDRLDNVTTRAFQRYGTRIPLQFLNPEKWKALSRELQNQGIRIIKKGNYDASYGYDAIELVTGGGTTSVLADRDCPYSAAFGCDPQYLKVWSMLELWHVMNGDGLQMLRAATSAGYEMRYAMYGQLACTKTNTLSRTNV